MQISGSLRQLEHKGAGAQKRGIAKKWKYKGVGALKGGSTKTEEKKRSGSEKEWERKGVGAKRSGIKAQNLTIHFVHIFTLMVSSGHKKVIRVK